MIGDRVYMPPAKPRHCNSVQNRGSWPVLVNRQSDPIFWGMGLHSCLLPDSTSLHPVSWHIDPHQATIALTLISQQPAPECPLCHVAARRLHSRYERTLADLPWAGWTGACASCSATIPTAGGGSSPSACRALSPLEHAGRCGSASASPPSPWPSAVPPAPGSAGTSASRPRATRCYG